MSLSLDLQFVPRVAPLLKRFHRTRRNAFAFRCPYCGDSKKSEHKTRGGLFPVGNALAFKCMNCSKGASFRNFLKFVSYDDYKDYVVEAMREDSAYSSEPISEVPDRAPEEVVSGIFTAAESMRHVYERDRSDIAVQYLVDRKMPRSCLDRLYRVDDFQAFVNRFKKDKPISDKFREPRIIIPLITKQGVEFGFQGRSILERTATGKNVRYLTVIVDDRFVKVYGMHYADLSKDVWVVEGAMDTFFLPNCVAALDSSLHTMSAKAGIPKERAVHLFDNEPRNAAIVGRVHSAVSQGFRVAFWPDRYAELGKDLNDCVKNGADPRQMYQDLRDNVKSGLAATLEFARWKKV